jgi:hypothetical protein
MSVQRTIIVRLRRVKWHQRKTAVPGACLLLTVALPWWVRGDKPSNPQRQIVDILSWSHAGHIIPDVRGHEMPYIQI